MNNVILVGTAASDAQVVSGSDGGRQSRFSLQTLAGDRGVVHKVRVVDEFLAQSVYGRLTKGAFVTVVGELDYDSEGAFVAVPARRGCDVQIGGAVPANAATSDVKPVASVESSDFPGDIPETVKEAEPAKPEPAQAEEKPSAAAPAQKPASVMRPGGLGLNRPKAGFGSVSAARKSQDEDVSPDEGASAQSGASAPSSPAAPRPNGFGGLGRTPMGNRQQGGPSPQRQPAQSSVSGPDFHDNDIPF